MANALRRYLPAPIPADEAVRQYALESYSILDTPPEPDFDEIAELAAAICQTPIGLVSLLDGERQWFKARVGLEALQTKREVSFCGHAILQDEVMQVTDARVDLRFAANPAVTGAHIRFYAGAPLRTVDGHKLGTVCVVDHVPRRLTDKQVRALEILSKQASALLELRKLRMPTP